MTDTPASPVQPTLSPFWQTATARVDAVGNATKPAFRPFESPAPIIATATPRGAAPIPANPTGPVASATASAATRSGSQLLDRTFFSATLGRAMPYFVYLPVGYAESGTRYPVLYMLHGYGGSNTEWIGYGLPETADHMMNAGEIPPMIIVLPQGDQAYWVNHANGGERWGDYTARDVVQQIDATYRTIPDAPHRAVGGLSMGGGARRDATGGQLPRHLRCRRHAQPDPAGLRHRAGVFWRRSVLRRARSGASHAGPHGDRAATEDQRRCRRAGRGLARPDGRLP